MSALYRSKSKEFKVVFEELKKIPMFRGIYDAKNGDIAFMNGIWTVMEVISDHISDKVHDEFEKEFIDNLTVSEMKAGI